MKKKTITRVIVALSAIFTVGAWGMQSEASYPDIPENEIVRPNWQFINITEYEQKRAILYDAALDLCMEASKGAYVWDEWVSEENKNIILNHRVPSLEVLLNAIEQMDSDGCLCDSFDEPLCRFDKAFYEFNKIAKIR